MVFLAHPHVLFSLERLMQALGIAATLHDTARELVDDLHLAVDHHIVNVAMEQKLRLQRLLQVVGQLPSGVGVNVIDAQHGLDFRKARLGGVDGFLRLVHLEVFIKLQARHNARELVVRVGGLRAGTGNDKRRARLVYEDGVNLVYDGKVMAALHARLGAGDHVVAQVVEAELGVRAVRDVSLVSALFRIRAHAVLNKAHVHAQEVVDAPHPLAVAASQVIVHRDDVHVFARKGVEIAGQRRHKRFTFAGAHLCDLPVVERHAADKLHVKMAHARCAHGSLAHSRKRLGQHIVGGSAGLHALAQLGGNGTQLFVGLRLHIGFKAADFRGQGLVILQLLAFAKREQLREETCHI